MHDDSVLANLLRDPEWDGKLYRALNTELPNEEGYPIGNTKTDGEPLWPDGWSKEALVKKSKEALVKKRRDIKDREFDLEYLNKSRSEEDSLFVTSRFQRFRSSQIDFNRGMRVILFWDPSDPRENKRADSDYAAISVVATKRVPEDLMDLDSILGWDPTEKRETPPKLLSGSKQASYRSYRMPALQLGHVHVPPLHDRESTGLSCLKSRRRAGDRFCCEKSPHVPRI